LKQGTEEAMLSWKGGSNRRLEKLV